MEDGIPEVLYSAKRVVGVVGEPEAGLSHSLKSSRGGYMGGI